MSIEIFKKMIEENDNIVFLGGAGVSTESGIPDFRSETGLYAKSKRRRGPKYIYTYKYYKENKEEYLLSYKKNMAQAIRTSNRKPNSAHLALAELERRGKLRAVITQNVDELHQQAGSKNVIEIHGSSSRCYCEDCKTQYNLDKLLEAEHLAYCGICEGLIRPDIVLYGEKLDDDILNQAMDYVLGADLLIVGGTSLAVYPAAGLVRRYSGDKLVIINKSKTRYDSKATLLFHDSIGRVLSELIKA